MLSIKFEDQPIRDLNDNYELNGTVTNNCETPYKNVTLVLEKNDYECKTTFFFNELPGKGVGTPFSLKVRLLPSPCISDISSKLTIKILDNKRKALYRRKHRRCLSRVVVGTLVKFHPKKEGKYRILVFGNVNSGKSSVINSFYTLLTSTRKVESFSNSLVTKHTQTEIHEYVFNSLKFPFVMTSFDGVCKENRKRFPLASVVTEPEKRFPFEWKPGNVDDGSGVTQKVSWSINEFPKLHALLLVLTLKETKDSEYLKWLKEELEGIDRTLGSPVVVITKLGKKYKDPGREVLEGRKKKLLENRKNFSEAIKVPLENIFYAASYVRKEKEKSFFFDRNNFRVLQLILENAKWFYHPRKHL